MQLIAILLWGAMSNFTINDESSNHKYRTELPNIIYEIGLTPNLIGVYSALKRAAGDNGQCTKSEKTLSKQLNISKKTLHGLIIQLCEVNSFLGKPLVICTNRFSECGDKDTNSITITDIWPENYFHFTSDIGGRVKITPPRVNSTQGVGQKLPQGRVKFTHKEEPIKKNQYEEEQQQAVAVFFDCLVKDTRLKPEERKSLMRYPEDRVCLAIEYSLNVKANKKLIQQLVWHCQQPTPPPNPKKNFWDAVRDHFKNYKKYNQATCYINEKEISLERGLEHLSVKFAESGAREKFMKHLKQFGIDWSCDE